MKMRPFVDHESRAPGALGTSGVGDSPTPSRVCSRSGLSFVVRGIIDGRPLTAHWCDGHLDTDPEVRRRAEVIVAMEDQFISDDGYPLQASLVGGFASLLTLTRAFTRVTSVEIDLQHGPRDGSSPIGGASPERANRGAEESR